MVTRETLVIRKHAAEEMAADHITVDNLLAVINTGDTIKSYPDDRPYPSRLLLAVLGGRAVPCRRRHRPGDRSHLRDYGLRAGPEPVGS